MFTCDGCGDSYGSMEAVEHCEAQHDVDDRQERRRGRR